MAASPDDPHEKVQRVKTAGEAIHLCRNGVVLVVLFPKSTTGTSVTTASWGRQHPLRPPGSGGAGPSVSDSERPALTSALGGRSQQLRRGEGEREDL
jgi:hypothetical protein